MMDCNSMSTPMVSNLKNSGDSALDLDVVDPTMYKQLIGSLMYLVNTRPNIFFAVSTLSQFMVESRHVHWVAAKHVLISISSVEVKKKGYTDSYWVGSAKDIRVFLQLWIGYDILV